jgi:glycosyltransferase involved in cell wall biosynthesis
MRVIFLTQWFDPEPGQFRGLPLATWLRHHGYEVKVITGFPNYPGGKIYPGYRVRLRQRETMNGVEVLRVPLYPSHNGSALCRVANYGSFAFSASTLGALSIGGADVAYVYHPPATAALPAIVLKALRRIPFVFHIADMWPESVIESGMLANRWTKRMVSGCLSSWCNWVYSQAQAITVLSPGFKRLLVERGVPSEKIHVVYNWADEDVFKPGPRDEKLGKQLAFRGRFNVVYSGHMGPYQGLETVVRAAALLKSNPVIQFVMVGTGQKEEELKALARELGVTNVQFLGQRPLLEAGKINNLADALLVHLKDLPFMSSTIPGKTQVSLASGRPILIGVRGDAADLVREAGAGVAFEPGNPSELARAVVEMQRMPRQRLEEMGARGREYYLNHLSLEVGGWAMDEIFKNLAGEGVQKGAETARGGQAVEDKRQHLGK